MAVDYSSFGEVEPKAAPTQDYSQFGEVEPNKDYSSFGEVETSPSDLSTFGEVEPPPKPVLSREDIKAIGHGILTGGSKLPQVNFMRGLLSSEPAKKLILGDQKIDDIVKLAPAEFMRIFKTKEQQDYISETAGYTALGFVEGFTANAPGAIAKIAGRELAEEPTLPGYLGQMIGSTVGFWLGPAKWLHAAYEATPWGVAKAMSPTGVFARKVFRDASTFGAYNFLSEWGGENINEVIKNKFTSGAHGVVMGSIMGAVGTLAGVDPKTAAKMEAAGVKLSKFEKLMGQGNYPALSFAVRIGINEYQMLHDPIKEGWPLPHILFNGGVAAMASYGAQNPKVTSFYNKWNAARRVETQKLYELKNLGTEAIEEKLRSIGDIRKIPEPLKQVYIESVLPGFRVTPENVDAMGYMFEEALKRRSVETYKAQLETSKAVEGAEGPVIKTKLYEANKPQKKPIGSNLYEDLKFVTEVEKGLEAEFGRLFRHELAVGQPEVVHTGELVAGPPTRRVMSQSEYAVTPGGKLIGPEEATKTIATTWMDQKTGEIKSTQGPAVHKTATGKIIRRGKEPYHGDVELEYPTKSAIEIVKLTRGRSPTGESIDVAKKEYQVIDNKIMTDYTMGDEVNRQAGHGQFLWREMLNKATSRDKGTRIVYGKARSPGAESLIHDFGAKMADAGRGMMPLDTYAAKLAIEAGADVRFMIDLASPEFALSKAGKKMPNVSWIPEELAMSDKKLRHELATGEDWESLASLARRAKLLYHAGSGQESFTRFNEFLLELFRTDKPSKPGIEGERLSLANKGPSITSIKDLEKLTKADIAAARKYISALKPNKYGEVEIPQTKELAPMEYFEGWRYRDPNGKTISHDEAMDIYIKSKGTDTSGYEFVPGKLNILHWLQSARITIKELYDLFKPAELDYRKALNVEHVKANMIFKRRINSSSNESRNIDMFLHGKLDYNSLSALEQDIANGIVEHIRIKAREAGVPFDALNFPQFGQILDGWALEQIRGNKKSLLEWYSENDPLFPEYTGTLNKPKEPVYDAVKSMERWIYEIEKYKHFGKANEAAESIIENLYVGQRKDMARTFVNHMNGRPTKIDKWISEGLESNFEYTADLLDKLGLSKQAAEMRKWKVPTHPISSITSPLARFYYFRYIGFAMDTAFKNTLQWEHAAPIVGWDNINKGMYSQFTQEGKALIEQMRLHEEGIGRGGQFIEEANFEPGTRVGLFKNTRAKVGSFLENKVEPAGYWAWGKADMFTRNVVGLGGYYKGIQDGMTHQQALKYGHKVSLETQFGYTKADSLLIDMANPLSKFVLFKKWPLSKVEMLRGWAKEGNYDAIHTLAIQEYMMYKAAKAAGVDMTNIFNSVWQLTSNWMGGVWDAVPALSELKDITTALYGKDPQEEEKAFKRLARSWNISGIRYVGKVADYFDAWLNDWQVKEPWLYRQFSKDQSLVRHSDPWEQAAELLVTPRARTEYYNQQQKMHKLDDEVAAMTERVERLYLANRGMEARELDRQRMEKYAPLLAAYGKQLTEVSRDDVRRRDRMDKIPKDERTRRGLPGTTKIKAMPEEGWPDKKDLSDILF